MDNDAFRALVADRARPKSTKEIAREAVEQEARDKKSRAGGGKKRRRGGGGGGGGGSSSEEYSDEEDDYNKRQRDGEMGGGEGEEGDEKEPKWKRERRAKRRAKEEAEGKVRYRDRAKERREGRANVDYAGTENLLDDVAGESSAGPLAEVEADMTKFLGGDEAHTHLVKGLDLALAQKVRREEMGMDNSAGASAARANNEDVDLDTLLSSSVAQRDRGKAWHQTINNLSARSDPAQVATVLNALQKKATTKLGREMAAILLRKTSSRAGGANAKSKSTATSSTTATIGTIDGSNNQTLRVTSAGKMVQRTKLQFSLRHHPGDVVHSWKIPREEVSSVAEFEREKRRRRRMHMGAAGAGGEAAGVEEAPFAEKLTPFDPNFVARIKSVLLPPASGVDGRGANGSKGGSSKKKEGKRSSKKHKSHHHDEKKEEMDEDWVGAEQSKMLDATTANPVSQAVINPQSDDSSDEDIFGDAGEYVPIGAAASKSAGDTEEKKIGKGSIFSGLTAASSQVAQRKQPPAFAASRSKGAPEKAKSVHFGGAARAVQGDNPNVIDRDVFGGGGGGGQRAAHNTGTNRRSTGGVSISDYSGGYGEDLDMDFTGADDDGDDKGKGDTTTAAKEYGKKSGGRKSDDGGGML